MDLFKKIFLPLPVTICYCSVGILSIFALVIGPINRATDDRLRKNKRQKSGTVPTPISQPPFRKPTPISQRVLTIESFQNVEK